MSFREEEFELARRLPKREFYAAFLHIFRAWDITVHGIIIMCAQSGLQGGAWAARQPAHSDHSASGQIISKKKNLKIKS